MKIVTAIAIFLAWTSLQAQVSIVPNQFSKPSDVNQPRSNHSSELKIRDRSIIRKSNLDSLTEDKFSSAKKSSAKDMALMKQGGTEGTGGGNWTEADLKYFLGKLAIYLYSAEGQSLFPEIQVYDQDQQTHPRLTFKKILDELNPRLVNGKVYDQFGNERDCFSGFDTVRFFACNAKALPPKPDSSSNLVNEKSEYYGSLYRLVLHEAFVQARLEEPQTKEIPSEYKLSSRLSVHLDYFPEWVPGKDSSGPQVGDGGQYLPATPEAIFNILLGGISTAKPGDGKTYFFAEGLDTVEIQNSGPGLITMRVGDLWILIDQDPNKKIEYQLGDDVTQSKIRITHFSTEGEVRKIDSVTNLSAKWLSHNYIIAGAEEIKMSSEGKSTYTASATAPLALSMTAAEFEKWGLVAAKQINSIFTQINYQSCVVNSPYIATCKFRLDSIYILDVDFLIKNEAIAEIMNSRVEK